MSSSPLSRTRFQRNVIARATHVQASSVGTANSVRADAVVPRTDPNAGCAAISYAIAMKPSRVRRRGDLDPDIGATAHVVPAHDVPRRPRTRSYPTRATRM